MRALVLDQLAPSGASWLWRFDNTRRDCPSYRHIYLFSDSPEFALKSAYFFPPVLGLDMNKFKSAFWVRFDRSFNGDRLGSGIDVSPGLRRFNNDCRGTSRDFDRTEKGLGSCSSKRLYRSLNGTIQSFRRIFLKTTIQSFRRTIQLFRRTKQPFCSFFRLYRGCCSRRLSTKGHERAVMPTSSSSSSSSPGLCLTRKSLWVLLPRARALPRKLKVFFAI